MGNFFLETGEHFEQKCAEIFKTTRGRISLHCTLCQEVFCQDEFDSFLDHLHHHITQNIKLETEFLDETCVLTKSLEKYLEVELDGLKGELKEFEPSAENEFYNDWDEQKSVTLESDAKKKEKTLNNRLKKFKSHKNIIHQNQINKKISQTSKSEKDPNQELTIPTEIREVAKRITYKPRPIADEERKHKCPVCNMGFKDRGNMIHHFKRHTNERKHTCSECGKKFFTSTELNSHIARVHTKTKELLCTECGKTFFSKSTLGAHLKRHRDQRDYVCPVCAKAFFNFNLLKEHIRSHSSERPFPCNLCDAAFKRAIALKNHLKLHENKREYKCELCDAGFNQKAGLFSHMKTAHKTS